MQIFRQLKRYLIYKYKSKTNIDNLSDNFSNLSIDEIFKYFGTDKATKWKHGKNTGIVYGGSSRKQKKNFQIGNKIMFNWKSKNENKIGYTRNRFICRSLSC